jgi:hypothetical protein
MSDGDGRRTRINSRPLAAEPQRTGRQPIRQRTSRRIVAELRRRRPQRGMAKTACRGQGDRRRNSGAVVNATGKGVRATKRVDEGVANEETDFLRDKQKLVLVQRMF